MAEANSVTRRVLDALVEAGLVTSEQVGMLDEAAASTGRSAGSVLLERGLVSASDVAHVLEDGLGIPRVDLSSYAPDDSALALVPARLARQRHALPLFEIEGMLTVAIGDPMDVFLIDDLARELAVEIEPVLADKAAVDAAIDQYYGAEAAEDAEAAPAAAVSAPQVEAMPEPEAEESRGMLGVTAPEVGAPAAVAETVEQVVERKAEAPGAIDLDVLAVADPAKTAVLVADILEDALRRRATRIHLLPYKDDFFLVYRIGGRLEKIASAPLSMELPLVEAFRGFARMPAAAPDAPAVGRVRTRISDREVVLTVSSVPTVAGRRMVVSIAGERPKPRGPGELGMTDAEERALHAMVERGRGILLVCAPVAGGRSSTYYSLLSHAASAGKTVYSVERSIDFEIPAVAQVLVDPGSPVGASGYLAAGLRQDTDVVAIDGLATVEDTHLAIEAAGLGKLVIATCVAADIASGIRRLLDLGAEPHSLAAALTLVVGQRLVRTNCPSCAVETRSKLTQVLPGAGKDVPVKAGAGCAACFKTGFQGLTGVFEVLPMTEPVRAAVARGLSAAELETAAKAAGMRPLVVSGLSKVRSGLVSPEELDRVLRFSEGSIDG